MNKTLKRLAEPNVRMYIFFMALFALATLFFKMYKLAIAEGCILIILVVIGHIWQDGYVHNFIYNFHMPAFFVISGAELRLEVFSEGTLVLVGVVYILFRSAGKYLGARFSAKMVGCSEKVVKYLGITLLPQQAWRSVCA